MSQLPPEAVDVITHLNALVHRTTEPAEVYGAVAQAAVSLVEGCDRAALLLRDHRGTRSVGASDEIARGIDNLELEIGDGPCLDAIEEEALQHDPDLTAPTAWPDLAALVVERTPVRGIIGCRLIVDGTKVGALDLFSDTPGALTQQSVDQATVLAAVASSAIATVRARHEAEHLARALDSSRQIGKAIGLLMAAHKVGDEQALAILRHTSQTLNVKLALVADEIVQGQSLQARRD